ncbi:UNVERIFIED_CONTAM: hypothetical protein PYX00_005407 [Menopon gallinae]|uniref:E3 ubiquitin-protein ligase CHFR n=1 Tax=Menopon gallinae TaxID=328185 RepID=A0AAW2HR66_9NEOP
MDKPFAVLKRWGSNTEDKIVDCSPFDIGRSQSAKLISRNLSISRNHCKLIYEKKKWVLQDLSSSGTYINDELIGKGKSKTVENNDIIRLGPKECGVYWQFTKPGVQSSTIDTQSRTIVDICTQKNALTSKAAHHRETYEKMKVEKGKIEKQISYRVKALHESLSSQKYKSSEMKALIEEKVQKEKEKLHSDMEKKLSALEAKISENEKAEENLKLEIEKLQEKLVIEQSQWENRFKEEKKRLEDKISEQNKLLCDEKQRADRMSLIYEQELENKLKKEEEDKRLLLNRLKELEQAKEELMQKLKESDDLCKPRLEGEVKNEKNNIEVVPSVEPEKSKNDELLKELHQVKNTLIKTESQKKLLEKELAEASSLKDEASRVKSNVLENIADVMESELQCSVCSELFVTPITLNCSHTFCKYCIETWKKKKKNCPICRKKITSENRLLVIDNYIDRMVENLSDEFKARRKIVIAERSEDVPEKKQKTTPKVSGASSIQRTGSTARTSRRNDEIPTSRNRRSVSNRVSNSSR